MEFNFEIDFEFKNIANIFRLIGIFVGFVFVVSIFSMLIILYPSYPSIDIATNGSGSVVHVDDLGYMTHIIIESHMDDSDCDFVTDAGSCVIMTDGNSVNVDSDFIITGFNRDGEVVWEHIAGK